MRRLIVASFAVVLPLTATACIAPFSEMHGARMVGRGGTEVTPFYSSVSTSVDGETEKAYNQVGLHVATGLNDETDLRVRVEHVMVSGESGDAFTVIGAGPKFALKRDRVALFLPVGVAFGDGLGFSSAQFHPALLFTLPLSPQLELNPSVKALVPLNGDGDVLMAANLGLAFGRDLKRFAVRPEFGILKNPGEEGTAFHYSVGVSFGGGR